MSNRFFLTLLMITLTTTLNAQKLAVPDSVLSELQTVIIPADTTQKDSIFFKVVYPQNYDATQVYPVLLGLSGGNQNEAIVNYCYAAWFKSVYFNQYITILPVNKGGKNLFKYTPAEIQQMLKAIQNKFNVSAKDWVIAGTSNGGRATFNFIAVAPSLFQGAIVIPGFVEDSVIIVQSWKHLKVILAYGDKDDEGWIKGAEQSMTKLEKHVKNVQTIALVGQGHILPLDFDIDVVYKKYFEQD